MKITAARVIVTCPGRNFVTLRIDTDQGVYGIGDATMNGREKAVVAYLEEHTIPCLIGRDPRRIEDTWQFLYRGSYWRRGPVQLSAVAAVDMALWDIKAKMAGMPLYQLLGGRSRERVLCYGHANGATLEDTVEAVGSYLDMGYRAVRAQSGIPGIDKAYGVARGTMHYEPADAALPTETVWDTPKYLRFAPRLFEAIRSEYGDEFELLHDVHHRLTPNEAGQLGKDIEPYRLFWMEDPVPAENQEGFRLIRERTSVPIAVGEIFNTIWDAKALIENQWIDYIRATVLRAGGVTHLRRIADFAALYHVRTGCHGATDLSPVTMGTALHFDTWVPNFGIQEYMRHSEETDEVFPHDYRFEDGYLHCGESAGHGVDIDEKLAARYPYRPAQLPVARLEDCTMWNW